MHRSEESLHSQRGQKAEQESRVIRREVSVITASVSVNLCMCML